MALMMSKMKTNNLVIKELSTQISPNLIITKNKMDTMMKIKIEKIKKKDKNKETKRAFIINNLIHRPIVTFTMIRLLKIVKNKIRKMNNRCCCNIQENMTLRPKMHHKMKSSINKLNK